MWLADSTSIQETGEQSGFSRDLYKLIDDLPMVYHAVLTLVDLYEQDYAEVAEVLKIPIGTVKSRLACARLRMSEKLCNVENRQYCLYEPA